VWICETHRIRTGHLAGMRGMIETWRAKLAG